MAINLSTPKKYAANLSNGNVIVFQSVATLKTLLKCSRCEDKLTVGEYYLEYEWEKKVAAWCIVHRHDLVAEAPKEMGMSGGDADFITSGIRTSFRVDVNQDLVIAIAKVSNFNVNYQQNGHKLRLFCSKCKADLPLQRAIGTSEIENTETEFSKFCSTHAHRAVALMAEGRKFREDEP